MECAALQSTHTPISVIITHRSAIRLGLTPAQVRDPVDGVFSAETMLRGMGVPLGWTLQDELQGEHDPRFQVGRCTMCVTGERTK